MKAAVVIPVYKSPDSDESISLRRCCVVLSKYDLVLVGPQTYDFKQFHEIADEYGTNLKEERFPDSFFKGISGYNRLMLSEMFYRRFRTYDYILIYQLDAYVFEDQLEYWCQQGYDYIGAPLIGHYTNTEYSFDMTMRVGNGGLSLRKVDSFLNFFSGTRNVLNGSQIAHNIALWKKPWTRMFVWLFMMCGWRNKPSSVSDEWKYNEDDFWSGFLDGSRYSMSKPSPNEALLFAFERFPKEMFKRIHGLPFGCHAWKKYEYEIFWNKYIR